MTEYRLKAGNSIPYIIIKIILTVIAVITLFPFYYVLIVSVASSRAFIMQTPYIIPTSFDLSAYRLIFMDPTLLRAMGISAFTTISGTLLSMICTVCAAYALSKKGLPGRNVIMNLIIFTMFFSGGLIPYYLLIKDLGLIDKLGVMIIPGAVSTINLIIMKNFFHTLPQSIEESAKIDGANDLYILYKIVIPISAPILATISLFYMVDKWNDWWTALLFISSTELRPLPIVLRMIVVDLNNDLGGVMKMTVRMSKNQVFPITIRMAVVVIAAVPILLVYPYLQKYFTKGIMLGSLKE